MPGERAKHTADLWLEQGVNEALVLQAVEYERRWGDLYLPPSAGYNGGPRYLGADIHLGDWSARGYIEAGPARFSVSYDFLIDDHGRLGVAEVGFVPLYESVEGWIEALALEYVLRGSATVVERYSGAAMASLPLSRMTAFPGISSVSDAWLIDHKAIVFVCRGMKLLSSFPEDEFAIVYSGIPDRDIRLGL